ncbi:uncharacterized protein LOC122073718 [Macadamia integrifolia]|uniref:uncharacterized protein LOC122073718 n=1 Tax=Macadamia integrifolia TaxID=60698 RepID=UPI001C4EA179|nr:uncharacterized protein LOC122073718 [Macadamia integrifolia]
MASPSVTDTSSETTPSSALIAPNVSPQLSLKLTSTNYMLWRAQFVPLLRGYNLLGYVDACAAWMTLANVFEPSSRTRVLDLKDCLSRVQKNTDSVTDYLLSIRSIADTLAAIDQPIADEDLVLVTLRGLRADYRDFATSIRLRHEPISFVELSGLLISHESFLRSISPYGSLHISTKNVASASSMNQRGYRSAGTRSRSRFRGRGFHNRGGQSRSNGY